MTRVEFNIARLVVHGSGSFDADAFADALRSEVRKGLSEGRSIMQQSQGGDVAAAQPVNASRGPAHHAASLIAGRLFG